MSTETFEQPYDYAGWQMRLELTGKQAAEAMGVSESFYMQLRRQGGGRKVYAWAAYGVECHIRRHIRAQAGI